MLQVLVNVFLEKFQLQKNRHVAMQKLFKERLLEKNGQVSEILKTMGTQMPAMKKGKEEMNKIAHVFLQKCFSSFNEERYVSRSIVELG